MTQKRHTCVLWIPKIILDNFFYSIGLFYYGNRCIFYTIDDFINVSKVVVPHVALFGILLLQHCAGINCLAVLKSSVSNGVDYLFTGSRDGTLKRWSLADDVGSCSATFESHVDWVHSFFHVVFYCSSSMTTNRPQLSWYL